MLGRDKARGVRQLEKKSKLWSSAHRYAIVATYKLMQDACLLCVTFFPSGKTEIMPLTSSCVDYW